MLAVAVLLLQQNSQAVSALCLAPIDQTRARARPHAGKGEGNRQVAAVGIGLGGVAGRGCSCGVSFLLSRAAAADGPRGRACVFSSRRWLAITRDKASKRGCSCRERRGVL
jgi:hypothetical protein